MKYAVEKNDKYTVFRVNEENLNSLCAPDLKSEFVILKNEGIRNLIVDLQEVKFVDSSGLSAILTANRLFNDGGSFVLTGVNHPAVKTLINISRLESVLAMVPTVSESVDYVMMEEVQRDLEGGASDDGEDD
jgi:anti-sigma B factor antagonist